MLYHVIIAGVRALDFLQTQAEVDMRWVASFGGSWGGFISLLLAGVDPRVGCVLSEFGGGGWADSFSGLACGLQSMPPDKRSRWLEVFDPIVYASRTKARVLISAATNDYFFWLGGVQRNYEALAGYKRLVMLPNSDHGFGGPTMADFKYQWLRRYFASDNAWPELTPGSLHGHGNTYTWRTSGTKPIRSATLYFSPGKTVWPARYWVGIPARRDGDLWTAELPPELARLSGQVYATAFDEDGMPSSSPARARCGMDPRSTPGPLWPDGMVWDRERGAEAWRPYVHKPQRVEWLAGDRLSVGPGRGATHFAVMTNSVVLASGRSSGFAGIRLKLSGNGKPGSLAARLLRDSRSTKEVAYAARVDYGAADMEVGLPWGAFKGPEGASSLPYPFDGLALEGDRPDGSPITITALCLAAVYE